MTAGSTDANSEDSLPQWVTEIPRIRELLAEVRANGKTIGVVPTMGNLHEGHASLMRAAREDADFVLATIFVNPLQFSPNEDFDAYPRTPADDRRLCGEVGVDAIFAPSAEAMYPPDMSTQVRVTRLEEPLCGRSRPTHFLGVATVCTKLFNILRPDAVYFGSKDYQQAKLIERLVRDLDFGFRVRICPTVREPDGLAMSSRNRYLSSDEREQAVILRKSLDLAERMVAEGERDADHLVREVSALISSQPLARIDYVELSHPETLEPLRRVDGPALLAVAVQFRKARLIDNVLLRP